MGLLDVASLPHRASFSTTSTKVVVEVFQGLWTATDQQTMLGGKQEHVPRETLLNNKNHHGCRLLWVPTSPKLGLLLLSSFRLIPKKLMSSYIGMEECQKNKHNHSADGTCLT